MGRPRDNRNHLENSHMLEMISKNSMNALMYTLLAIFIIFTFIDDLGLLDFQEDEVPFRTKPAEEPQQPIDLQQELS